MVFIGAVFVSAVAENNPNNKNQIISDETIKDPEFAINSMQDLYRKYNVNETEITFTTNDITYLVRLNTSLTFFQVLDRLNTSFTIVVI
ncbi:MAG: hypothetical protein K8R25_01955 [Methanosarcinales archaeon]|nr:hypothetical protein [Methanosarcinales archaeon]